METTWIPAHLDQGLGLVQLLLASMEWMSLVKSHNLSDPQFLHLQNGQGITHPWEGPSGMEDGKAT